MTNPTIDITSDTWLVVKTWAEKDLEESRALLEGPMARHNDSDQIIRGRIKTLRDLLDLIKPKLAPVPARVRQSAF